MTIKNKYEIRGEVTAIFLIRKDKTVVETLIDTCDLEKASQFTTTWFAQWSETTKSFYARGNATIARGKYTTIPLHRFLMGVTEDPQIDHINHNTLDNRRSINLRSVSVSENQQNQYRARSDSKTGVMGVSWKKSQKKYCAKIQVNKKGVYLGYFSTIEEAERSVKEARAKYMPYSQEALSS